MNPTKIFILLVIFGLSCTRSGDRPNIQQPNVVIILTDDQGWGDLSYNGNENLSTPNIDDIARKGAVFSNFYVSPVCSPTRAEILTGRYHLRGGVQSTSTGGERLDLDETTIADVFKQAGYKTATFGKWHNGMQYPYHPNGRGFDEFYGFASGHWGDYFDPKLLEHNGKLVQGEGYIINDITNKALDFIEQHQDKPFFAFLSYNTPHSPMQVPEKWWDNFEDTSLEMRHKDVEKEDVQFTKAALAMVENIDWNVGKVIDKLQNVGIEKNTIVVFMSDNGPNSWRWNGGMRGRKGSTDEGGTRVPFFIKWPGMIQQGLHITKISAAIDILPTLADLAGIPADTRHPVDGKSLNPLITSEGEKPSWNDRLIFSYWNGRTSVRNSTYRLDHQGRLYNIREDRGQRHNLSDQKPDIARQLSSAVKQWEKEMKAENYQKNRPFTVGHPDFLYTQLPARDGIAHGTIERSNRYPNATFFTNWKTTSDSITWDIEVLESGTFDVTLYYTISPNDIGAELALLTESDTLTTTISQPHDPPLTGMEHDRVERIESYVKDFKPLPMGRIDLEKGRRVLKLEADQIPGRYAADIRLILLKRMK